MRDWKPEDLLSTSMSYISLPTLSLTLNKLIIMIINTQTKNQVYLGSLLPSVDSGEDLLEYIFFQHCYYRALLIFILDNQDWKEWHLGSVTNSAHKLDLNSIVRESTSYNPTMIIFVKKSEWIYLYFDRDTDKAFFLNIGGFASTI